MNKRLVGISRAVPNTFFWAPDCQGSYLQRIIDALPGGGGDFWAQPALRVYSEFYSGPRDITIMKQLWLCFLLLLNLPCFDVSCEWCTHVWASSLCVCESRRTKLMCVGFFPSVLFILKTCNTCFYLSTIILVECIISFDIKKQNKLYIVKYLYPTIEKLIQCYTNNVLVMYSLFHIDWRSFLKPPCSHLATKQCRGINVTKLLGLYSLGWC